MVDRLHITDIGHRGDGVADVAGEAVFVPYTLPGETVDADRVPGHPDRRHLLRVIEPSPDRIRALLPAFRDLRRLRNPAMGGIAVPRLEAQSCRLRIGSSRYCGRRR